jgi:hypothetical protein
METLKSYLDFGYDEYLGMVQDHFKSSDDPLFRTDADLWHIYLDNLDPGGRQQHNCHCCRRWFERYAGLVRIDEWGNVDSAMWKNSDYFEWYDLSHRALRRAVLNAKVISPFYDKEPVWGQPVTGPWTHFWVPGKRFFDLLKTPHQAEAEKIEDFKNISHAIREFSVQQLEQVVMLLKSDSLYRGEKTLAPAEWLLETARVKKNRNLVWRRVALAPAGFCHPRSSMIGTLLDDLASGYSYEDAGRRFKAKMHPLQYQRPQAAPKAQNIERAEEIVAKLGISQSLERRYAHRDEVPVFWVPSGQKAEGGIFGHLKNKPVDSGAINSGAITWVKFHRDILPSALKIEVYNIRGTYTGVLTAVHPDAPLIFQWPSPFSWFVHHGGSEPEMWSLKRGTWTTCYGIMPMPEHESPAVVLLLEGARRTDPVSGCLFPEILKKELREVRSVIEAHSKSMKISCPADAACGRIVGRGARVQVRVNGSFMYDIDRWE